MQTLSYQGCLCRDLCQHTGCYWELSPLVPARDMPAAGLSVSGHSPVGVCARDVLA